MSRYRVVGIGTIVGKCPEFLQFVMEQLISIDIREPPVDLASLVRRRMVVWSRVNLAWLGELRHLQRALQPALFRTSPFPAGSSRNHLWRAITETFTRAATAATVDPGGWWEYICGLSTEIFVKIPDAQEPGEWVWTSTPGLLGDGGFTVEHEYPAPVDPGDVAGADGLFAHLVLDVYEDQEHPALKGCPVLFIDTKHHDVSINGLPLPRTEHPYTTVQATPASEVLVRKWREVRNPVTGRMDLLALGPDDWWNYPEFCAVIRFPLSTPGMRHVFGSMNYHIPEVLLIEGDGFVSFRALSYIARGGRTHAIWSRPPTGAAGAAGAAGQ